MGFSPKQLQEMVQQAQSQAELLKKQLEEMVLEGSSGGGAVSVRMNGHKQLLRVKLDPETVKAGDVEMLEDLVAAAVNDAARKADEAMKSRLGGMIGGLNLPGIV